MLSGFDYRSNSIGFLRFLFAALVIWSHSPGVGGFGEDPIQRYSRGTENAGTLAVAGFFFLSGFLITRSYGTSGSIVAFMWHRFLRIFPGFWVCLVVTAFAFAPLAFAFQHGSLSGFVSSGNPWGYVANNALLQIRQPTLWPAMLAHNPYPLSFNAPLWTLGYEFLCYLAIGAFGLAGILRSRPLVIVALTAALLVLFGGPPLLVRELHSVPPAFRVLEVILYFGLGACAFLYRERIPIRGWLAATSAVAVVVAMPTYAFGAVLPICLSYAIAYVAMKWPIRSFDRRADFSYGMYIYAFPIAQMLTLYGVNRLGLIPYFFITFATALALASASWFCIEKPSLSLKHCFDRALGNPGRSTRTKISFG